MKIRTMNGGVVDTENLITVKIFSVHRREFSKYKTFYEVWVGLTGDRRFLVDRFNNLNDAAKLKKTLKEKN